MSLDGVLHKLGVAALIYIGYCVVKVGLAVFAFFFRAGKKLRDYGEWGVVTGATDGIG
eukprot:CAMPEP_0204027058 /NCGR_PEP_ID=MMETSP0360-20130528/47353_1 /ASSEMBLY_ACC=CAM_ASM_000342 /TAXON_ID=268821 /ORGANISM="Scrippsiella Hangoei, Strain SHTV-5" /LENGTH=57 /DNA_ID=CAMNT_0050970735 /DNA_START=66 /DNA_END=235 /DNA_ORIENTATION=-